MLSILIDNLAKAGLISSEEASGIKDVYSLGLLLEGKYENLLGDEANHYLRKVKNYIQEGLFTELESLTPPAKLKEMHESLVKLIPKLKENWEKGAQKVGQ